MKHFIDKEYHPVIENYIIDYVDDNLELAERNAFEEVLVNDDDIRALAFNAKGGKKRLQKLAEYAQVGAKPDFLEKLRNRIELEN